MGLLIPFESYIQMIYWTPSRLDFEEETTIPFIGDLPTSDTPSEI
jgi:hypothetical protein